MTESVMRTYPARCVGCRICQLMCSFLYHHSFNWSAARILVDQLECGSKIGFSDKCTQCGVCAEHCIYGALELVKEEGC